MALTATAGSRLRRAALAGYWYPGTAASLRDALERLAPEGVQRTACRAVVVPHGSFQQSGRVAGETFSRMEISRRCILLGPHHVGARSAWSVMASGAFETPLGNVPVDEALASRLLERCPFVTEDHEAHWGEHAIEAQVPFLQWLGPSDVTMVPLLVSRERPGEVEAAAAALAAVIREAGEPVSLIASADLTHYQPAALTAERDHALLDAMRVLDVSGFLRHVEAQRDVLCGAAPIACVMEAARRLGATAGRLVRYATSADSGGDPASAIGYAGMLFE